MCVSRTGRSVDSARRALWHLRHGGVPQLRTWWARRRIGSGLPATSGRTDRHGRLAFDAWPVPERDPRRPGLRVGVVLDDFSRTAFAHEWDQVLLDPTTWRETLESTPVDLLFVESAWAGNGGAWSYHLTGTSAPRPAFVELVSWCREHGVPTVFWNKEDPAHFDDFLDAARLFDQVLTTDSTMLPAYRDALGHDRVSTMSFAAQPAIHNPVRAHGRGPERDVAFAGMYFTHRYPERREQMDLLLGAAHRAGARMSTGLEIFSRQLGGDPRYQFPEPFAQHVVGSLRYEQMLTAYREYKVFLNVNSVVGSPSMCARRIFEITACGTPVVSTPSAAIDAFFPPDEVFTVSEAAEAEHTVRALVRSKELRDRATHRAQRRIWSEHTYGHRVGQVLAAAGLDDPALARPSITAIVSTNRPHQVDHVLRTVAAQVGVRPQLAMLTHGFDVDRASIRAAAHDLGIDDVVLLDADQDVPLGACLNLLVDAADGEVVAKMDDDDLYGPHYLSDQLYAMDYSGADVVGKQAHYVHLGSADVLALRSGDREHRLTDRVMGPTITCSRNLARVVRFPPLRSGEDTGFLVSSLAAGSSIYSADRFNFVQVRRPGSFAHTWTVSDAEILAGSDVQVAGLALGHVMV
ncbi:glycosyltransferase family protein [Sanguibacter suaedae]|uniref:Glycosyltransferase n=1 Tax=Sanguibacter suaedae TaxID=2795737 RepID=A0A934IAZ1_9MICO|nr:glycosyltransferase [Sanguibacter suaedae]